MRLIMEYKDLWQFIKNLPLGWRIVAVVSAALFALALLNSCANTKAVVRASSDNTSASVTITTNNPTTVNVTNRQDTIGLDFSPKK